MHYSNSVASNVEYAVVAEPAIPINGHRTVRRHLELFPRIRFMGSKHRLVPWIMEVLDAYRFDSLLDAFSGSSVVGYAYKADGKRVFSSDFLNFSYRVAHATVANPGVHLEASDLELLLSDPGGTPRTFIQDTFNGVFYTPDDLRFLDHIWTNLDGLDNEFKKSVALAALIRSCIKRQPRGVFTISNGGNNYDDGRRDLKLSLSEHFLEQVEVYNSAVFDNGQDNRAVRSDVFAIDENVRKTAELVYLDPPYVPRSDDNDYIKRYHFVEGLSTYWAEDEIIDSTKVKKIPKRFTPFAYRRTALEAFDSLFKLFQGSIIALSYSSNAYPDLDTLVEIMSRYKRTIRVNEKEHRYHFGTHGSVKRAVVQEYLIVGS